MNTTELYVEYIIIGLETLCWIILLFFINIGEMMSNFLKYCVSNIFPSIILMGVCYVLGLITDRLSDRIFENRKKKIKQKYPIKAKASLIVWDKWGSVTFAKFTLSRIRILRSTVVNSVCISIFGTWTALYYNKKSLAGLIFLIFSIIAIASNSAHITLLDNYYKKTSVLDKEIFVDKKG